MSDKLTHLDADGKANMVDVGDKPESHRTAIAEGWVTMKQQTLALIREGQMKKGDVLSTSRIAGIMGAKQTSHLIPLCHPLILSKISVDLEFHDDKNAIRIVTFVRTHGQTGVEMEALTAVSVSALTIYDMAKAVDRTMQITGVRLLEKHGGVHGDYKADK